MSKPRRENIFSFLLWWIVYHGDENPARMWKEIGKQGYHNCRSWADPESKF